MTGLELLNNADTEVATFTPPWTIWKTGSKQKKEEWFKDHLYSLQKLSERRIETHVNNLLWYTGEYDKTLEYRMIIPSRGEQPIPRRVLPRIFNHLFDITEQRVSRLSRYKPSFDIVPANSGESADRSATTLTKLCLERIGRRVLIDHLMQAIERWSAVFGEVLVGIDWDKNLGDKVKRGSVERTGDVDIYIKPPWTYFPEPKAQWSDVTWCLDIWKIVHFEEARVIFNDKKIDKDGKKNIFEFNRGLYEKRDDEVVIYRLVQKPTQFYPEGKVSFFCNDRLVDEFERYPYSHMDFPYERHTDIDVPGRLFPMSFYQQLLPIQHVYNRLTSVMVRNLLYVGHPHILNPIGSGAKREAFGNAPTEIRFNPVGGMAPSILTFKSVPQEFFQFRNEVRGEINQVSGVQGVSRGAPPPGVRAASMLRFFAEQEEQRASTLIIKHNELIRRIYQKAASLVGDYYPQHEDRLYRIVGPEYRYLVDELDSAQLQNESEIIILNSTGFSQDMSGRLEEVALITQLEKDKQEKLLTGPEIADILQLRNPQKAYDIITSAQRSAELNIELFRLGKPMPEPQIYWDLITNWRTTMIFMNSPEWQEIGEKEREPMLDHLLQLEVLMEQRVKQSAAFAQAVSVLPGYPSVRRPAVSEAALAEGNAPIRPPQAPPQPQAPQAIPTVPAIPVNQVNNQGGGQAPPNVGG